uniref:Uncharacterized protein LOC104232808 n=1 Tax=Nicotiana sylvestris TaxID=4096 RepID=A0A1U7WWU6_NICSY|nr:PREDICTED: uncharacterized protein LOC104232808 [Nicotiana sylvestris]
MALLDGSDIQFQLYAMPAEMLITMQVSQLLFLCKVHIKLCACYSFNFNSPDVIQCHI